MPADGAAIVVRARTLIGTRFRPQGRSASGIDCIGLVAAALGKADTPAGYALRCGSIDRLSAGLRAAGLSLRRKRRAGDVLAMRSGPQQLHLGVWTGDSLIHADAGLRRVVERPGEPSWPVLGIWRED